MENRDTRRLFLKPLEPFYRPSYGPCWTARGMFKPRSTMARTSALLVKGVLVSDYGRDSKDNDPSLAPFIRTANIIVNRVATCASAKGHALSAEELAEIETWLAAHGYKMSDQQPSSTGTQGASGSFRAAGGLNLDGSTYGQMARMLDTSGCLAAIADPEGRKVAGAFWNGKRPSQQTNYVDRS